MNKVMLMGRLTRDPEIRYSNAAEPLAVVRYSLAVDRRLSRERRDRGDQAADFINCVAFGKAGEFVERYFRKGQMVSVVGRLRVESYEDNTGQRRWSTDVVTEEHFFAESRASFESRGQGGNDFNQAGAPDNFGGNYAPAPSPQQSQSQQPSTPDFFEIDNNLDDNDLPF